MYDLRCDVVYVRVRQKNNDGSKSGLIIKLTEEILHQHRIAEGQEYVHWVPPQEDIVVPGTKEWKQIQFEFDINERT
jgi:hypothetical protein